MTALEKYQRLEASGIWRPSPQEQRRDVVVSIGDATLLISDTRDRVLAHWSLPAVERANPGTRPAMYFPDGDPSETLELADGEDEMIAAIEKLRAAIGKSRPHPGRLRLVSLSLSAISVAALTVFWLPGAMLDYALNVVPDAKRHEIGIRLLDQTQRLTGQPCSNFMADPALTRLTDRLDVSQIKVVRDGVRSSLSLPGGIYLLNRAVVEDFEEPDVAAGFVIVQKTHAAITDPLRSLLQTSGTFSSFRLLTTGTLPDSMLKEYAEHLIIAPRPPLPTEMLVDAFAAHQVRARPYALAVDPSGETTLNLIEADQVILDQEPVLNDGDWVALQGICDS